MIVVSAVLLVLLVKSGFCVKRVVTEVFSSLPLFSRISSFDGMGSRYSLLIV